MALERYDVEIDGHTTTLQLNDEDAKMYGLTKPAAAKAKTPAANKQAPAPQNKGGSASASKADA